MGRKKRRKKEVFVIKNLFYRQGTRGRLGRVEMPKQAKKIVIIITMVILPVFVLFFSFSTRSMEKAGNLTNFRVMDAGISDVLQGLANIGNIRVLMDRRTAGGPQVNIKFRDGIGVVEAVEQLARTYGYAYKWDIPAQTVIVGNEQTFKDYENMETRVYDTGSLDREKIITTLTAVFPGDRLEIEPAENELKIRTSILEHRIIDEIIDHLRRPVQDNDWEITVQEIDRDACRSLGIEERDVSLSPGVSPRFTRVSREQTDKLIKEGKLHELEVIRFTASGNEVDQQFVGDLLPVIRETGEETQIEYRKVGVDLTVTSFFNENGVTIVLQTEINRIKEWEQASGGIAVPVMETGSAGTVVSLAEGESLVVSGLDLVSGNGDGNEVQQKTALPLIGRFFSSLQEFPGEKTELCLFINPYPGEHIIEDSVAGTDIAELPEIPEEIIRIDLVEEEKPAAQKEDTAPAGTAKPEPGISRPLWEAEVVELGSKSVPAVVPETPVLVDEPLKAREYPDEEDLEETRPPGKETDPKEETRELEPAVPIGLTIIYRVQSGDTIFGIAAKYGIPAESIVRANDLSSSTLPGRTDLVLPIPADHLYPLKAGETLWRLAGRYGVTVELLMEINQISEVTQLTTGQIIILPTPVDRVVEDTF